MAQNPEPKRGWTANEIGLQEPDLAAREPAEGDLDQIDPARHLCCPEAELSSELPVEAGGLADRDIRE